MTTPVFTDATAASLEGLFTSRMDFRLSGGYSSGKSVFRERVVVQHVHRRRSTALWADSQLGGVRRVSLLLLRFRGHRCCWLPGMPPGLERNGVRVRTHALGPGAGKVSRAARKKLHARRHRPDPAAAEVAGPAAGGRSASPGRSPSSRTIARTVSVGNADHGRAAARSGQLRQVDGHDTDRGSAAVDQRSDPEPLAARADHPRTSNSTRGAARTAIMEDVVQRMRDDIDVADRKGKESFRVSYVSDDPQTAQKVTERLASLFIEENLRDRENAGGEHQPVPRLPARDAKRRLIEHEKKLEEYRRQYAGQLPSQLQGNLQAIQNAQLQLQRSANRLNRARERRLLIERQLADARRCRAAQPSADRATAPARTPRRRTAAQQLEVAQSASRSAEAAATQPITRTSGPGADDSRAAGEGRMPRRERQRRSAAADTAAVAGRSGAAEATARPAGGAGGHRSSARGQAGGGSSGCKQLIAELPGEGRTPSRRASPSWSS